jgi:hypothetical protein
MKGVEKQLKERVLQVLKYKNMNVNSASKVLGIPQRTLNRQVNEDGKVGMELLYSIMDNFVDISPLWLVMGDGEMILADSEQFSVAGASPYYNDLPVSAGLRDSFDPSKEVASGYISMPQWKAQFYFPVIGTSMEPEIHAGDIVGVNKVESLREVDPDKIYMIVTNESRMIKRCYHDAENPELLWCVSPNYPSFAINKGDICALFHVVNRIERL